MQTKDELGDRMKAYEAVETARKLDTTLPIYARIDGRGFSKFTKHMIRPFDLRMTNAMIDTTKYLVDVTHAAAGYVQSDEISLVWSPQEATDRGFFAGKVQKMVSVLASMTAARFAVAYRDHFGEFSEQFPHFDCRVCSMPSLTEATNMMLWREMDARKNAVSMAARHYFSHRELHKKSTADMIAMMAAQGHSMDQYPDAFVRGTWVKRVVEQRSLTDDERAKIPVDRQPEPDAVFDRTKVVAFNLPPFNTVDNRVEMVFDHVVPV
jgi:tRNA(His) guanylyltransferase